MMSKNTAKTRKVKAAKVDNNPANRDPITGAPGAHPVGAGAGTAAGAAAGAAIGAVGGPIGAAVGLVAGGVVGGLAGKAGAEHFNPTVEEAYWREQHFNQPYAKGGAYDEYHGAYRTGYEGYNKYYTLGRDFDASESDLRNDYERFRGNSRLTWDEARDAARAAWLRLHERTNKDVATPVQQSDEEFNPEGGDVSRFGNETDRLGRPKQDRYVPKERSRS